MSLGFRLVVVACSALLVVGALDVGALALGGPAGAARRAPASITATAPPAYAGGPTTLRVRLTDPAGEPVADAPVALERRSGPGWVPVATLVTDDAGHAERPVRVARDPARNRLRLAFVATAELEATSVRLELEIRPRASRLVLAGPHRVVDGRSVPLRLRWSTPSGQPVAGVVRLARSLGGARWQQVRRVRADEHGRAAVRVTPRVDSRWRATGRAQSWVAGDRSRVHRVDNRPPVEPVRLPAAAPSPRRSLPAQSRSLRPGPRVVVSRVPDRVWAQMTGVTWRAGCPVGRAGLRLVRVGYWDYGGYARRGELVAAAGAARAMGAALAQMYRRELPVRGVHRVDRFGWSARSHGGDDYASMAAGNTSAFNCRDVTGRPGVRSPHSWGRSLDLNTWENPYRSAQGLVPDAWWQGHAHPRVAWRSRTHAVVRIMARHGLRWTYGLGDTQHFDYVGSSARARVAPRPCDRFCD